MGGGFRACLNCLEHFFIERGNCLIFPTGVPQRYYRGIVCDFPGVHWIFIEQHTVLKSGTSILIPLIWEMPKFKQFFLCVCSLRLIVLSRTMWPLESHLSVSFLLSAIRVCLTADIVTLIKMQGIPDYLIIWRICENVLRHSWRFCHPWRCQCSN